ncbi:MAG: Asp-tRNA(Asn)/Glu-tRNA(Gln) amidotransferase subunit GatC [Candidatus Krumholzibacteriota bacterium]|nr:Asp-tRNA(Asn)/Glu-tRNA(Gln) amidotransferase subunit GatC [Candidatus Krumholzibacteriota bacterium]
MELGEDVVRHVESLARLELTGDEREAMRRDLQRILDYVAELAALDLADVPPFAETRPGGGVLREDAARPSLPASAALDGAPAAAAGHFVVPPAIAAAEDGDA